MALCSVACERRWDRESQLEAESQCSFAKAACSRNEMTKRLLFQLCLLPGHSLPARPFALDKERTCREARWMMSCPRLWPEGKEPPKRKWRPKPGLHLRATRRGRQRIGSRPRARTALTRRFDGRKRPPILQPPGLHLRSSRLGHRRIVRDLRARTTLVRRLVPRCTKSQASVHPRGSPRERR